MIDGYRVVVCSPVGRRVTLEILKVYMLKLQGVVDEWRLWMNVKNMDDLEYINALAKEHPDYIKQTYKADRTDPEYGNFAVIKYFYEDCTDDNTIYVRIDDDVVFIDVDGFKRYLKFRVENPEYFLVNPIVVNNSFVSWKLASLGVLHDFPEYFDASENFKKYFSKISPEGFDLFDPKLRITHLVPVEAVLVDLYWRNPEFVRYIHSKFLDCPEVFKMPNWELSNFEPVSIHCISWFGRDFKDIGSKVNAEEEPWLQTLYPFINGRKNIVFGDCVVSHYSYYCQVDALKGTNILDRYKVLAFETG
jgi:hypothetical protein